MSKYVFYIFLWLIPALLLSSCRKEVRPTSIEIKDPDRHYYPIKQGQQLDIMFTITNTGNTPLLITDIQPSCGCIIIDKSSHVIIPEHGTKQFRATYNSIKKHRFGYSLYPDLRKYSPCGKSRNQIRRQCCAGR